MVSAGMGVTLTVAAAFRLLPFAPVAVTVMAVSLLTAGAVNLPVQ